MTPRPPFARRRGDRRHTSPCRGKPQPSAFVARRRYAHGHRCFRFAARSRSGIRSSQNIPPVPPVPPGSIRPQGGIPSRGSYPITSLSGAIVPPTCREVKCFLGAVFPPEAGAGLRHNWDAKTPALSVGGVAISALCVL